MHIVTSPDLLSSHCSDDMRCYINNEHCRRKQILSFFPNKQEYKVKGCKFCDVCAAECSCSGPAGKCQSTMFLKTKKMDANEYQFNYSLVVSNEQKSVLQSKLSNCMNVLREKSVKPVLFPNIFFLIWSTPNFTGGWQLFQVVFCCWHQKLCGDMADWACQRSFESVTWNLSGHFK